MKYTDRFTTARRLVSRRARTAGDRPLQRSHTPRHEAFAIGLGCGRTTPGPRPEWR